MKGSFFEICRIYFSEFDECSSNPCKNSGTCVDKLADYQCTCLNGFTGKDCETGECSFDFSLVTLAII